MRRLTILSAIAILLLALAYFGWSRGTVVSKTHNYEWSVSTVRFGSGGQVQVVNRRHNPAKYVLTVQRCFITCRRVDVAVDRKTFERVKEGDKVFVR